MTKRFCIILFSIAAVGLLVVLVIPFFARAKEKGGPGVAGNLRLIDLNKLALQEMGRTNEWPSADDVYASKLRSRHGEIYIVNRTGEPACVYFPRTGRLLCLKSNVLVPLQSR